MEYNKIQESNGVFDQSINQQSNEITTAAAAAAAPYIHTNRKWINQEKL